MKRFLLTICLLWGVIPLCAQDVFAPWRASWAKTAEACKPELSVETVLPSCRVEMVPDASEYQGYKAVPAGTPLYGEPLEEGVPVFYDLGRHVTGYLTVNFQITRRCQDAPVRLRLFFGELPSEMTAPLESWASDLGRGWMQEEILTVEDLSRPLEIPRRLSGRYLSIELLSGSRGFDFTVSEVSFKAVSSASFSEYAPDGNRAGALYDRALNTLRECMQTVYEDGPKRDRRLWGIDAYFGTLSNNSTFKNHNLTKRSLYLLASLSSEEGLLFADVFEAPSPHPQDGNISLDCSLFYPRMLLEYAKATGDVETVRDLWPVVVRQVEAAKEHLTAEGLFCPSVTGKYSWLIFDWNEGLDRDVQTQGIMIWALRGCSQLAEMIGERRISAEFDAFANKMAKAVLKHCYDRRARLFVSGPERQVSWNSQIWMVVSGVVSGERAVAALESVARDPKALTPGTPAANHFLVEAYLMSGMNSKAGELLTSYWGGMVTDQTDTLFEVYDPSNDYTSPYGCWQVNSYCHLWSTTPLFFFRTATSSPQSLRD